MIIWPTLGWGVEICAVIWSHSLAFRPALPVCSSITLSLVHSKSFHTSNQRSCRLFLLCLGDGLYHIEAHILPQIHPLPVKIEGGLFGSATSRE